jgi:flagellar biosynthesis/type III secretory pathway M-ring protein FliF/YscJ
MFKSVTLYSTYFCLGLGLLWLSPLALANPAAEKALEAKIQGQLEAVLGPGKAKVTVSGGSERARRQSRSVTHHNPQTAHERIVSETQAGVTRRKVERIYTYDHSEALTTETSGNLTQKSVSVIYEPPKPGEDPENAAPPLDPALVETIVRTTARINESQGDQLQISQVKMDNSAYERLKAEMEKARQGTTPLWIYGLCALGGIIGGVGLGFFLARRRQRKAIPAWENPPIMPVYPGIIAADTRLGASTNQALGCSRA